VKNMLRQYAQIARMLMDRRVTGVPREVLAQLARRGNRRLPADVQSSLGRFLPGLRGIRFIHRWLDGELITRHNGQWVLNSFLPPFPGAAFDRMFQNLLTGRRLSPVSAFLAVTSECPYRCWHCSYKRRAGGKLSTVEWTGVISGLHELGASIIGFTGGEPCSREDLPELIATASKGGAATVLFSSGACMDEAALERYRGAGLWSVCISLDHINPDEHDRLRGAPGSHERAVRMLETARRMGFYTMIGTVGTRNLIPLLQPMHELAARLGVHELRIVEPMPCGLLAENQEDALLSPEDVQRIRAFHVASNRKGVPPKICAFNQIESPELFGCGAGTQHMFIDARGEVCPCDFTAMSFGNCLREPLPTLWARMNEAMGNPRRHCFARCHSRLIVEQANGRFPLTPEASARVCREAGKEPLPDYFQQMLGRVN
jgi:MoaA/NifB/PqqE/SkfB family radical SAM enzyme